MLSKFLEQNSSSIIFALTNVVTAWFTITVKD